MAESVTPINRDELAESLKIPPHSVEAEQAVLGGLMLDNGGWEKIADSVTEIDFYRHDHRLIFAALSRLAEESKPFDVVTLAETLNAQGELDNIGGIAYLGTLATHIPSAANIKTWATIVRERSVLRQLIGVANGIAERAFHPKGQRVDELLDEAEQQVFNIADQVARQRFGFIGMNELMTRTMDRIDHLFEQGSSITGVATGFDDFDDKTSGLQRSDLVIIAGRPSMGKTTFAMNIAEHAALKHQLPVAIFSMEMPGEQLALRLLSSLGRIDQHRIRTGRLHDDDWPRLTSSMSLLSKAPIYIDDTAALTPIELRARARRLAREHELGLIMIDYLQLMRVSGTKENRATEISEISRSLKALAKELNVPVIALSQLNRSLEQRPNKRPVMSDLRESGAIEQDADVIAFIYRDEVYNEESPDKGVAEIIIGKQRNGPIGSLKLVFRGQYTRFDNFAGPTYADGGGL